MAFSLYFQLRCRHPGVCNQIFVDETQRDEHEKEHRKSIQYKCDLCNKSLKSKKNLKTHQRNCRRKALVARTPHTPEEIHDFTDSDEFVELNSAFKGTSKALRLDFAPGHDRFHPRIEKAIEAAGKYLQKQQASGKSMKYFLSLHMNFYRVQKSNSVTNPPICFNSGSCILHLGDDVQRQMEIMYVNLMHKVKISYDSRTPRLPSYAMQSQSNAPYFFLYRLMNSPQMVPISLSTR